MATTRLAVMEHRTTDQLEAGAAEIARSPIGTGRLELIVRRPVPGEREVLDAAELDLAVGLVGDTWNQRSSRRTPDGSPHPDMQLNIMNVRAVALIAGPPERWPLAGDQLYVDLHLGDEELPPGTRLRIGGAVVETGVQPLPRTLRHADDLGGSSRSARHEFTTSTVAPLPAAP